MEPIYGQLLANIDLSSVILSQIGTCLAKMHSLNVIHGDLTTSNMMLNESNQVVLIGKVSHQFLDFGLGFISTCTSSLNLF